MSWRRRVKVQRRVIGLEAIVALARDLNGCHCSGFHLPLAELESSVWAGTETGKQWRQLIRTLTNANKRVYGLRSTQVVMSTYLIRSF